MARLLQQLLAGSVFHRRARRFRHHHFGEGQYEQSEMIIERLLAELTRDLHLVMGPAAQGQSMRFRVLIDGQAPGAAHFADAARCPVLDPGRGQNREWSFNDWSQKLAVECSATPILSFRIFINCRRPCSRQWNSLSRRWLHLDVPPHPARRSQAVRRGHAHKDCIGLKSLHNTGRGIAILVRA